MSTKSNKLKKLESCLAQLKEMIRESQDKPLNAMIDQDDVLKTFIIGRKYNVQRAFETAKGHYNARQGKFKHIFAMPPDSVRHVVESGFMGALKHRDEKGRLIAFMRIPKLDILRMEFDEILRAATLLVDYYWTDYAAIESGQVVIIDYSGYNLSIFRRYSFTEKLNFVMLFLNNYPSKFKEAHIYNNPKLVGYTFNLIKPFLPDKLRKRVFLHSYNRDNLLNHFSPEILPEWMGGTLSDEEAIDQEIVKFFSRRLSNPNVVPLSRKDSNNESEVS